ncbi:GNAT family N-acetyltransferase [Frankia sp. AgPm24]|uniref:GNAT family N-acetyltransferase n=1 Tax=Frankia umida TaxID=573489 RepID=A0ABT0JZ62_9ACTN|nr:MULTISPECIES: GNAT family N-acetyltransferase [Frankia]MCK9876745.1 GNAT family N-acetyltransferase [Frankia umida]MCK9922018.1 GNAT family N-acetyltransferase [Frankia sp. AgPm24]
MTCDIPPGMHTREPREGDHPRVLAVLDHWWEGLKGPAGAQERRLLLPRYLFQHFTPSSRLVESDDGELLAFLIGFLSQTDPASAYIHFVGVAPTARRGGLGTHLYRCFFAHAAAHQRRWIHAITSPENTRSVAFHTSHGFTLVPGDSTKNGTPIHSDHDGPDTPRVVFTKDLHKDQIPPA